MFVNKEKKSLKRWDKYKNSNSLSSQMIAAQTADLKNDKVRTYTFYIPTDIFKAMEDCPKKYFDFSQYFITKIRKRPSSSIKNLKYMKLSIHIETKKVTKINEKAYIQLNCYDAYRFSDFVVRNKNTLIKGLSDIDLLISDFSNK